MGCVRDTANLAENVTTFGLKELRPLQEPIADVALAASGNAWAIPIANAGITAEQNLASGQSVGKSIGQGAIAGGEALAGQELAGAVGIGQGNTAFNSALGITGDNPAGTGLPNIGGMFTDAIGSVKDSFGFGTTPTSGTGAIDAATGLPMSAESTNAAGATVNNATGATVAAPATSTFVSPSSGGGFAPATAAADLTSNQINTQLGGDVAGASTSASPNLGSVTTPFPGSIGGEVPLTTSANSAIGAQSADALGSTSFDNFSLASPVANAIASGTSSGSAPGGGIDKGSSGGMSSWLPSKGDVGKALLSSALPLAGLGYEASKGAPPLPTATQPLTQNGAVTAPLIQTETNAANAYNSGTLTPPQQASIDQWVQDQQNMLIQQLANSGVTNMAQDSRYFEGMNQIKQQALAQKQQMLQQDINNAFSAAGVAGQNLGTVANAQVQNDAAYQEALAAAMAALGGSTVRAAA